MVLRHLSWLLIPLTVGCKDPVSYMDPVSYPVRIECYRDSEGLVWMDRRLMESYEDRRNQIDGSNLCYPHVGLTRKEIEMGRKCPHPKQQIVAGWCRCVPSPDVLFTGDDIDRWCASVK